MNRTLLVLLGMCVLAVCVINVLADDAAPNQKNLGDAMSSDPQQFLNSLVGTWEGNCKTWFKPGELADESAVRGEFKLILGDHFLRHTYQGGMQGKPRSGEETIVFNSASKKYEIAWIDDFHMNYGILFSDGEPTEKGFSVFGKYAIGGDNPAWGWRTEFILTDNDHLTIIAYNVTPEGEEYKGVETNYTRQTAQ